MPRAWTKGRTWHVHTADRPSPDAMLSQNRCLTHRLGCKICSNSQPVPLRNQREVWFQHALQGFCVFREVRCATLGGSAGPRQVLGQATRWVWDPRLKPRKGFLLWVTGQLWGFENELVGRVNYVIQCRHCFVLSLLQVSRDIRRQRAVSISECKYVHMGGSSKGPLHGMTIGENH